MSDPALWLFTVISLGIYVALARRTEIARQGILTYPKQSASFAGAYAAYGDYKMRLFELTACSIVLVLLTPIALFQLYFALMVILWRLTWLSDFRWDENPGLKQIISISRRVRVPIGA